MPNGTWLKEVFHSRKRARDVATTPARPHQPTLPVLEGHRAKRVRDETTTSTDLRQSTSHAPGGDDLLQFPPTSTSSESDHPFFTVANVTGVADTSLKAGDLPQHIGGYDQPPTIQKAIILE